MPGVAVLIPYAGTCEHRARALAWVTRRHRHPVTVSHAPEGPWRKAAAVNPALDDLEADIVVVSDADVWTEGLQAAIDAVAAGAAWAMPHDRVWRLTEHATAELLAGGSVSEPGTCERPYHGIPGGGIVVAPLDALRTVPLDPRFTGWGQEDESWAVALECLLGLPWRGAADLLHLYHPPQPRMTRRRGSPEGWELRRRYMAAGQDRGRMLELVEEARAALAATQQARHDHPPLRVG